MQYSLLNEPGDPNNLRPRHVRAQLRRYGATGANFGADGTTWQTIDIDDDDPGGLTQYWRILMRQKSTVLLLAFLGVLAAIIFTVPQTPVYRALATVEIENVNENFLNMRDLSPTAPNSLDYDIQTQTKLLQSTYLLERTLNAKNSLEKRLVESKQASRAYQWRKAVGLAPVVNVSHDAAVGEAASALRVRALPNTRIIEITFDSTDPSLASDFANSVASEFIELTLEQRWRTTQHTSEWLAKQMQDIKIKLEKSEEELQNYARASNLIFTSEKNNLAEERLRQLQEELLKAQAERVAKQSLYELASTAPPESLPQVLDDATLKDYQVELTTLRRQLAELSSSFTPTHPKVVRVEAQIAAVSAAFEKKRQNIEARVRNDFDAARRRENLLQTDYAAQVRLVSEQADKVTHYNILKREVDSTRQLYESMFQRVKEAGVASAMRASNIHLVDPARPPGAPYKPHFTLNAGLGLLSGMFLGIGLAVVRERSDRSIQAPGDAMLYLNTPELGIIPSDAPEGRRSRRARRKEDAEEVPAECVELTALQRRLSVTAAAFRTAVTSILFSEPNGSHPSVLVVSSPATGEGKTTVSSNLAIALAQANLRVLLVDGDLHRPRLHQVFDIDNRVGLSEILAGEAMLTVRETKVPKLFLLPSGGNNESNLLFTPLLGELLKRLRSEFDMILIDSPPMLQLPDARVFGRHADGVVLVVRSQRTSRDAARLACERLQMDGTALLGTILNDWKPTANAASYGYHAYGYHDALRGYSAGGYGAERANHG